ncbi:sulfite exporter TauE/SafE family protein [Candidatus Micrarchaeota archaeon]|nr:sulfite exporter TauE/SafE family protein [Candidatus Micrarchaeota archaeon]
MDEILIVGGFVLGLAAGVLAAIFGIGGAMLIIPAFRIFFGLTGHEAIATTVPLTIPTALAGAMSFHMKGVTKIKLKTAIVAGLAGIIFSVMGAYMTGLFNSSALMFGTGVLFFFLAYFVWNLPVEKIKEHTMKEKAARTALLGGVGGFLNGFFGIGGGGILVPLLMKFRGLPIKMAVPTSLAIIVIYSTSSSLAHLAIGNIVLDLLIPVMAGSVIGVYAASHLVVHIDEKKRRAAFVAFMILMGILMILRELFF